MGNLAEGVSQTPMRFPTRDTHATSPDTGFDHGVDDVEESFPRGADGSHACRATPEAVGVSAEEHAEVLRKLKSLRETVVQNQRFSDETQTRLFDELKSDRSRVRELELQLTRVQGQLDMLIQMSRPVAMPTFAAQATPNQRGTGPDTA